MRMLIVVLALASLGACRPDSYARPIRVVMPSAESDDELATLRRSNGPRVDGQLEIEAGSPPSALRPADTVRVLVPGDEVLPRGVRSLGPAY